LPKVKFEGRVTPNEDEYQKSVQLQFWYCLGVYHNSPLFFWLHAYWQRKQALKFAIFTHFGPPWPWHCIG